MLWTALAPPPSRTSVPSYSRMRTGASRLTRCTEPYRNSSATRSASTRMRRPSKAAMTASSPSAVTPATGLRLRLHRDPFRAAQDRHHRFQQVVGHHVRPARPRGRVVLQLAAAVPRPHQHAGGAHAPRQLEVAEAVADHVGPREVDAELVRGAMQKARAAACGSRTPGGTGARPPSDGAGRSRCRPGARPRRPSPRATARVHLVDEGLGKVAAGDPGLVRHQDGEERAAVHQADRLHREGEEAEAREVVDVADLLGERAVAIDEDRPAPRLLRRHSRGEHALGLGDHAVHPDARHAAMVDRALAELAGRAVHGLADDAVGVADRARLAAVGRAEHRHDGDAEGGGHVHGAGVVGDEQAQARRGRRPDRTGSSRRTARAPARACAPAMDSPSAALGGAADDGHPRAVRRASVSPTAA